MNRLEEKLAEAERKAWDNLGRYKFLMAGYHMAVWVSLNQLSDRRRPNPFRGLVDFARQRRAK